MPDTMPETIVFQREKQRIAASEILQAIANGDDIKLYRCTISGQLDINRLFEKRENFDTSRLAVRQSDDQTVLSLSQSMVFNLCTFEEDLAFSSPWSDPDKLLVIFKKDVSFNSSVFSGQCRFGGACFHGLAGFDGCCFEMVTTFRNSDFQSNAMFRTAVFHGYCLLSEAVFSKDARFTNTNFAKGANFTNVKFKGRTDFSGVYSVGRSVPVFESVQFSRYSFGDGEDFWRFIKQTAQEAGHYQLAGESFYNERCAHLWRKFRGPNYDSASALKKAARFISAVRLLPELVFGRLLFGYGERPIRVLVASLLVILFCALIYMNSGGITYRGQAFIDATFLDGLYFSTVTFTTLGFGDLHPEKHHFVRYIAMGEALCGVALMSLFIVCLAKRYSRG
jgi:hypothetical protein